jgi:hypothetical protein
MLRRKTSERKAATQALQVIAESIRACKGRGGRKPAELDLKLGDLSQARLKRCQSQKDAGSVMNTVILDPKSSIITRRDSMMSSARSQCEDSRKANKENFGPNTERGAGEVVLPKKRGRQPNALKGLKMVVDED